MSGVRDKPESNGKYRGWFVDARGKRKTFTGTTRKAETRKMAQSLEENHLKIRLGYVAAPHPAEKHKKTSFSEIANEYLDWGHSCGGRGGRPWGRTHARERRNKLYWWQEQLRLKTLGDLYDILPKVERVLRGLQSGGYDGNGDGVSRKTLKNYSDCLCSFCNWAVKRKYLSENPVSELVDFDTTPENTRRAFSEEEVRKLLTVAPEHMRILYETALMTGFRAGELRSLTTESLDMDNGRLLLGPDYTKNRKPAVQHIPEWLVKKLAAFSRKEGALKLYRKRYSRTDSADANYPENPLLFVPTHLARAIKRDMKRAGIPMEIPVDGKADFHSLRVTYISQIVELGATVKESQHLARHSSPDLTMNVYARTQDRRMISLVDKLGEVYKPESKCAEYVRRLKIKVNGIGDKPMPQLKLTIPEPWWRRRDSNPRPFTGTRQATTCLVRLVFLALRLAADVRLRASFH